MPLFSSLWNLMGIQDSTIENIFVAVNSTPGVLGTQFALITGFLAANGQWYEWLLMILTYLVFFIPSVFMVFWSYKILLKTTQHKYLLNIIHWLKPVIIGMSLALAIELFLANAFPHLVFNKMGEWIGVDNTSSKALFVTGWRQWVAIVYTFVVTIESFYLYCFKKVSFVVLIFSHIILGLLVFQPWLN